MVAAGLDGASLDFLISLNETGRSSNKDLMEVLSPILNATEGRHGGPSQAAQVRFVGDVSQLSRPCRHVTSVTFALSVWLGQNSRYRPASSHAAAGFLSLFRLSSVAIVTPFMPLHGTTHVQVRQWLTGGGEPPQNVYWVRPAKRMAYMPSRATGGEFKHGWSSRLIAGQMTGTLAHAPHMAEMLEAALAGLRALVGDELCGLPVMVVPGSAAGPVGEQGVASGSAKKRSGGRRRTVVNKVGRERQVGAVHSVRERNACVAAW
jgi:hypothetical protein